MSTNRIAAYLKIENPGVADPAAFTLLGATTKKHGSGHVIGKFGSGNKHGIAVLLRNDIAPTIFCSNLRLNFDTRDTQLDGHHFEQVVVKYGGKDESGKSRSSTEDLGFVKDYGIQDWTSPDLGLREFISNSLDRVVEQLQTEFVNENYYSWAKKNDIDAQDLVNYSRNATYQQDKYILERQLKEWGQFINDNFELDVKDYQNVVVEVVNENQVRAKTGFTRIFVPLNDQVLNFYNNLHRWFLHFSEPESINKTILRKNDRNITNNNTAVIYRRGVRVREITKYNCKSLFDYNLERLQLDESRKVDDSTVTSEAAKALADGSVDDLKILFKSWQDNKDVYWEHGFSTYDMDFSNVENRKKNWGEAFKSLGQNTVFTTEGHQERVKNKGFEPLVLPEQYVRISSEFGLATCDKVLTKHDLEGREILPATKAVEVLTRQIWDVVCELGMTKGRPYPGIHCFSLGQTEGQITFGFADAPVYESIYLNASISDTDSEMLHRTILEELGHHVTKSTDYSRDFQDWIFVVATKMMRK